MQENNFEKQVQQKMDELSMSPSTEVWQKLSVTIAKDKRDRRFLIVIFLLLLLLTSTVYLISKNPSNKVYQNAATQANVPGKAKSNNNPVIENNTSGIGDDSNTAQNSTSNRNVIATQQQSVSSIQNEKSDQRASSSVAKNNVSFLPVDRQGNDSSLKPVVYNQAGEITVKTKQQLNVKVSRKNPENYVDEIFGDIDSANVENAAEKKAIIVPHQIIDFVIKPSHYNLKKYEINSTIFQLSDSFVQLVTTANKKELVAKEKITLRQGKGWKLGLNFSFGAATTQAGLLGIIGPGSGDGSKAFADPLQNSSGGGVTPGSPVVYYPSRVKTGAGILVGAFVQKSISTRSAIVLGLNFKMLTSSIKTGARVDSAAFYTGNNFRSANFYYRNGSQQSFTNHFYFIELPVSLKLQLSKQKKVPVYLTTGISLARLIKSNALQFDVTSGSYYHDNALLNKTQLNGSLGVLFSLNSKNKNPFLLGPDLQYSFNKMSDAGLYKGRHYSFIGLTLQKTIGKK